MAIAAVMAADLFNGLNTHVWTGWIFFAVFLGIVLVWAYTVSVELVFEFERAVRTHASCRLSILSFLLDGSSHLSLATTTTSSLLPTSTSASSWSSSSHYFHGTSPRPTSSRSPPVTWIALGGSPSSTRLTTSRRIDTAVSLKSSVLRLAKPVSVDLRSTTAVVRTCPRAFVRQTEASTSLRKKTALQCRGCRATYLRG